MFGSFVIKSWPIFADYQDYDLQDFWPKNQDSSLFSIIKEFDDNNRNIQLIDIQSKINSTYYDINVSNLYPNLSFDLSGGYGEQNLAGLGLSDDLIESIQGSDSEDNGNQNDANFGGSSNSFGSSSFTARLNTFWEIDLWGRIRDLNF